MILRDLLSRSCCAVFQNNGDLAAAEALCQRLLDYGAASKEHAKTLLREIRAMQVLIPLRVLLVNAISRCHARTFL